MFKLIDDWRAVLRYALSIRYIVAAFLFTVAEVALPLLDGVNTFSAILEVTPGDYFELEVFSTAGFDLGSNNATWFAIEEVRDAA